MFYVEAPYLKVCMCATAAIILPAVILITCFLGTALDNVTNMYNKGRQSIKQGNVIGKGGVARQTKLSPNTVRTIREMSKDGISQREIARQLSIHRSTIRHILKGRTWANFK